MRFWKREAEGEDPDKESVDTIPVPEPGDQDDYEDCLDPDDPANT